MPEPLPIGVIGLGAVAVLRHLPILTTHPNFKIVAAAETDPARAETIARQFSLPAVSPDPRTVIESPQVQVVTILTPPAFHAPLAHQALDAGKHVFIEKPLTLDVAEAQSLVEHAERVGTKLLVGFNQRHHVQLQRARAMLQGGELGTLRAATTFLGNTYRRATMSAWHADPRQGDLLFEVGVHHFDALRYLLSAEVTELSTQEAVTANHTATLTTQMRWTNGMLTTTTLAEDSIEQNTFEFVGERGKLSLALYTFDGLRFVPRGTFEGSMGLRLAEAGKTLVSLPAVLPRIRRGGDYVLTYRAEWDHFYNIIQNDRAPLATARDGLEATRLANAARESVSSRAPVSINRL